ncbi:MAG: Ig-like domain-containing protein [Microbacterium sp.]
MDRTAVCGERDWGPERRLGKPIDDARARAIGITNRGIMRLKGLLAGAVVGAIALVGVPTIANAADADTTAPTVTVKDGSTHAQKSFKLYDAGKIDRLTVNGVAKDLANGVWSDLNSVKPGVFGAIEGLNTLVVFDVAGNATTLTFWLDTAAPVVSFVTPSAGAVLSGTVPVTVNLADANLQAYNLRVDSAGLQYFYQAQNGDVTYNLDTTTLSDGVHTLLATATDKVGQKSTTTIKVTVDNTAPVATFEQVYQAKEGGRIAVTATFDEPLAAAPGQGWYGSGTTYTKVYYSSKTHTISFADALGNAGTATFTVIPVVAPAL